LIHYVDSSFTELCRNPFDNYKPYENNWVLLKLIEKAEFFLHTSGGADSIFNLIITKENKDWRYRVFDFIQYEKTHGNNMIISVNKNDLDDAKRIYGHHSFKDNYLRAYEQKVLMHSTDKDSYNAITKDGILKSWNILNSEHRISENHPIGNLLGDPFDYSDYIMFSNGGVFSEVVVASKQKGYIEMNIDCTYTAGARLYFDCEKIAKDGLLVRDGAHLKVKNQLLIDKYLIWTATPAVLDLQENTTPQLFAEKADTYFKEKFPKFNC